MGLMTQGTPCSWPKTKELTPHVKKHGIRQFVHQFHKNKNRSGDPLLWGDETEYMWIKFDHEKKRVRVKLTAADLLDRIKKTLIDRETMDKNSEGSYLSWHSEYSSFQIESTPAYPYSEDLDQLRHVKTDMAKRRQDVISILGKDEALVTITAFFRLGCGDFSIPNEPPLPNEGILRSVFVPDKALNTDHKRFINLNKNIRERRGRKIAINVPVYKDTNTQSPFREDFSSFIKKGHDPKCFAEALPDHVFMDDSLFGFCNCCLQCTYQAPSLDQARHLYDQLTVLTPIMHALSASTPILRGYLCDTDTRWPLLCQGQDDRTEEEMGWKPLDKDRYVINKSRYDTVSCYISNAGVPYNDTELILDNNICDHLMNEGVEEPLARHIAHIFIRDSVSLFEERLHFDDENEMEHFENLNTTVWQTMRFKPPPANSDIGWRVEFRPMDIQMTDFENAAYTVFVTLLTRIILTFDLNLLIPISKVDENMERAYKRDAVLDELFYFPKNLKTGNGASQPKSKNGKSGVQDYCQMTIDQIINGSENSPGLITLINKYLDSMSVSEETRCSLHKYMDLISMRASGELHTASRWIRNQVSSHPEYRRDSVVTDRIAYDVAWRIDQLSCGQIDEPTLLPCHDHHHHHHHHLNHHDHDECGDAVPTVTSFQLFPAPEVSVEETAESSGEAISPSSSILSLMSSSSTSSLSNIAE